MTRVKICGLTDSRDVRAAVDAGADAIGAIVDVPVDTHREVDPERAVDLLDDVPPFVASVLVTMPDTPARAIELVERVAPDVLQVHGDLPPGDLAFLAASTDVFLVLAVDADDLDRAREVTDVVDAVLIDSLEDGAGGTGQVHDWDRTRDAVRTLDVPVVLAGGLTPRNVGEAVATVDPFAVDVASGVEGDDGRKDHDALQAFVDRATRQREARA
jgi:phosphoribosylanthranilate isomerase